MSSDTIDIKVSKTQIEELEKVVIRFVGDSGDGMQLTGTQFSDTSAMLGNDIATFPNYPAEIRAPQGSLYGVSGFQVHIGNSEVSTPGDEVDVLVAMNPAGLKTNLESVPAGKTIIVDIDAFSKKNLGKAGYESNPLEDGSLDSFRVIESPISSFTKEALKDSGLDNKSIIRSKNMFALGMVYWMFNRPLEHTEKFIQNKFAKKPEIVAANIKALKTGFNYAETIELIPNAYTVLPAKMEAGTYRIIMGNQATAWGLIAATEKVGRDLFLGTYPITPASDILHELSKHKYFGVRTFQAEDEIAGVCSAIGAAYAGSVAVTTTSGPGLALKGEAIGLALMTELPLVIVDVQRGGPSTGLPTKTEQSDLLQAVYGRNGDSPVIVIAASTPSDCFTYAYMAVKYAIEHMTPVILLTDGYIANGAEPWKITNTDELPPINANFAKPETENWLPYKRDAEKLAREWAVPGMKGLQHRIGGLEKEKDTGNVNYQPLNHEYMVKIRQEKVDRVANYIPDLELEGSQEGDLLVVGWGGTYGSLHSAVRHLHGEGHSIGLAHFNYINPLPKNTEELFSRFKKIIVCELNTGQMVALLRIKHSKFDYLKFNKIQGLPFTIMELSQKFQNILKDN
jgi:2-oxoglutarate/2-oxoacid ferredoxin oxidoreductase subunit alpha